MKLMQDCLCFPNRYLNTLILPCVTREHHPNVIRLLKRYFLCMYIYFLCLVLSCAHLVLGMKVQSIVCFCFAFLLYLINYFFYFFYFYISFKKNKFTVAHCLHKPMLLSNQYNLDLKLPSFIWRQGIHALQ